jgi:N-sulfoglucosamine sulfohydrolase
MKTSKHCGNFVKVLFYLFLVFVSRTVSAQNKNLNTRPNIVLAISDDQSWPHAGIYGCTFVKTPVFDRIAKEGILFMNGFAAAPQCGPSRAALLTGRNIWQNEEAGVHGSLFPKKFPVFTHLLEAHGYHVGYTGKGWAPGKWDAGGQDVARESDPVGKSYNKRTLDPPFEGLSNNDYSANFADFLNQRNSDQPFFFWFGSKEPHRPYQSKAFGIKHENSTMNVVTPSFMPDADVVKNDLLNYAAEIEWFDRQLGQMVQMLEEMGELDNTIIIVTSDNGMPFPRAKMQNYEYGNHVPLAIRWGKKCKGGRKVSDLVSLIDFAPTFLDAAGVPVPVSMSGKSMMNLIESDASGQIEYDRTRVVTGKERHSCARPGNLCYPIRAIRTDEYYYVRNLKPERWPAGNPPYFLDMYWWLAYDWPSASYIIANKDNPNIKIFYDLNVAKRPHEELYDIRKDPGCLNNLAQQPEYEYISKSLWNELKEILVRQKDPRMMGRGDCFDSSPMFFKHNVHPQTNKPLFPDIPERGEYNNNMIVFDHSNDQQEAVDLMRTNK